MNLTAEGKRVIITAGAAGIGRVVAETFIENGARVHVCDEVEERLTECRAALPGLGATLADVADPAQVDRLFDEAAAHLGGLDVLVNNAGIAGPTAPVEAVAPEEWDRTLAVNISGQFYCARRAVPLLRAAGGGSIVNLSSTAGLFGFPNRSPYAASKWAVIGFTKTLAMELGPERIRVNAICPGSVAGPRIERVIAADAQVRGEPVEKVRAAYERTMSMRTFIEARDVASMILFLVSEAGSKISGQALSVDGHTETLRA
jgi:NAD(P)-dependent dehydrogenase (short-subunit alcohol dehydrogenase family)